MISRISCFLFQTGLTFDISIQELTVDTAHLRLFNRLVIQIRFQPTKYLLRRYFSPSALLTIPCADDTDVVLVFVMDKYVFI
jgi:hypothetical protein